MIHVTSERCMVEMMPMERSVGAKMLTDNRERRGLLASCAPPSYLIKGWNSIQPTLSRYQFQVSTIYTLPTAAPRRPIPIPLPAPANHGAVRRPCRRIRIVSSRSPFLSGAGRGVTAVVALDDGEVCSISDHPPDELGLLLHPPSWSLAASTHVLLLPSFPWADCSSCRSIPFGGCSIPTQNRERAAYVREETGAWVNHSDFLFFSVRCARVPCMCGAACCLWSRVE